MGEQSAAWLANYNQWVANYEADAEEAALADYLSSAPDVDGLEADWIEHYIPVGPSDGDDRAFVVIHTGITAICGLRKNHRRYRRRLAVYEVEDWGLDNKDQYLERITLADYDRIKACERRWKSRTVSGPRQSLGLTLRTFGPGSGNPVDVEAVMSTESARTRPVRGRDHAQAARRTAIHESSRAGRAP